MLQGDEPLHYALDVALVSLRTSREIVGGVFACEIPCGGDRYVGSGLSKYDGMQCTSRWERISATTTTSLVVVIIGHSTNFAIKVRLVKIYRRLRPLLISVIFNVITR